MDRQAYHLYFNIALHASITVFMTALDDFWEGHSIGLLDLRTIGLLDFRAYSLFVLNDLRRDVLFCFVDIADHRCFNLLFIKQNDTIQHTLNQVVGNVILLLSVNLNSAYHCGTFFKFLKGIGPRA